MNDAIMKLDWQAWMLILLATSALLRNGFAAYNKILDRIQNSKGSNGNGTKHFEPCQTLKDLQKTSNNTTLAICERLKTVEVRVERIPIIEQKVDELQRTINNGFLKRKD